jgi:hypothetical protein
VTTVTGGVYAERCVEPYWDDVYGSGGRAAAAISAALPGLNLVTYRAEPLTDGLESLSLAYGISISGPSTPGAISFDYFHSLAVPRITPRPDAIKATEPLVVEDDVVLRFGMLEGTARIRAGKSVYDPQSAFDPRPFGENGSKADHVALILNRLEARRFTGMDDPEQAVGELLARGDAEVVVLKMGGRGALVGVGADRFMIPPYMSNSVFKIGSGDVFSAAFLLFWGVEGRPPEQAADLASRATSTYVGTRALPIPSADVLAAAELIPATPGEGCVYLAAPFFNLAERWIVEEIRMQLIGMGVEVFSPFHDVGEGPGEVVAKLDLEGLDRSKAVLAILNGADAGTIFEVGYAVARDIPVVALAQNMRPEDIKMPSGTGCQIVGDMVSAIYKTIWAMP